MFRRLAPFPVRFSCLWLLALALVLGADSSHAGEGPAPRRGPGPGRDEYGYPTNTVQAFQQGQAEARKDLTNGVLVLKFSGLPAPEFDEYQRLLRQRCGMQVQPIAGCLVTPGLVAYQDGYNRVTTAVVTQRFGADIFARLHQDARSRAGLADDRPPSPPKTGLASQGAGHTVRAGETLVTIARQHQISLDALKAANPGLDPRRLQLGQRVNLPVGR